MLKFLELLSLPLALIKKLYYSLRVEQKNLPGIDFHRAGKDLEKN